MLCRLEMLCVKWLTFQVIQPQRQSCSQLVKIRDPLSEPTKPVVIAMRIAAMNGEHHV